ncbi:type VI secretion system lipoprotein TssJ [Enterobacter sp. SA187]|uniref:type VI secretion system lipoprotein TssJ n=1 Tax=Enterobacter sp. SA187 TaxID=1914861 RepID=UPI00093419D3|nr:type VI secretion system lipoprotein TssJ [Enterobacter sp. SA187]
MAITAGKKRFTFITLIMVATLCGCGLTQKVGDSTVAMTRALFFKQVKILHLDIIAREAANNNAAGIPLSTVIRIYQLKDRKVFDDTDYPSLFAEDSQAIKSDLVAQKDIRLRPGASITIDMPLEASANYVAVAALFLTPDTANNTWRVVLNRDELDPDVARKIEMNNQTLALLPLKDD